ncbi:hypothetical protein DRE_03014 [Drechslerella stenobrocha 248]|uniref:G-protein coupled receptors family 1 profile domain-containing protein n=1 Tax=Drechslerella stenobrocha 248 TaxID=1043628 RepID=W7HWB0_9PEZI|nr:hypothetical protein DRE_03014 [Drechslerella stenobrocha 248]
MSEQIFFCICAVTAILLLIVPFLWQVRKGNVAAALLVFWLISDLILSLADAIIWPTWHSVIHGYSGRGYCDFVAKWKFAAEFGGINASVMCIMITIYRIFWSIGMYRESKESQRLRMWYEWGIAGGFPMLLAGLHYVVQPSRYYLTPVYGCHEPIDNSWVSLIVLAWPVIFASVSVVLAVFIMIKLHYHMQDRSLTQLFLSDSDLDASFKRLYLVVGLFTLIYYPTNIYGLVSFCLNKMLPYSWSAVHADWWNTIYKFPDGRAFQYQRWVKVVAAWCLFVIFGRGGEAAFIYWDIAKLLHVTRQVQVVVHAYKKFRWTVLFIWIPTYMPNWMKRCLAARRRATAKKRHERQLAFGAAPLGGRGKRQGGFLASLLSRIRSKLMGQTKGAIQLNSDGAAGSSPSSLEEGRPPLPPPGLAQRIARMLRTRVGRPKIQFSFNITWIRDSFYSPTPAFNFSRYRLDVPPSSHFCDTFDATTLEKIAQQAGGQIDALTPKSQPQDQPPPTPRQIEAAARAYALAHGIRHKLEQRQREREQREREEQQQQESSSNTHIISPTMAFYSPARQEFTQGSSAVAEESENRLSTAETVVKESTCSGSEDGNRISTASEIQESIEEGRIAGRDVETGPPVGGC